MKFYNIREQAAFGRSSGEQSGQFDLRWMLSTVLQHRRLIIVLPLTFVVLAVFYVLMRPANYTATTQLQLTNLRLTFIREDAFFAETHPDPSFLETQLQIMRSDRVGLSVLNSLKMIAPEASVATQAEALQRLRAGLSVERAGLSNVVQIAFTAREPETAARIANEFVRAYVTEQNAARLDAAQSGSSWLRERLREVGPKARVIAEALPPLHKSNARGLFIIAAAGMVGGLLALAGAIVWRILDRRVVTPEEVAAATGVQFLGSMPAFPPAKKRIKKQQQVGKQEKLPDDRFVADSQSLTYVLDHQLSETWHTLRNVRAASQDCMGGKGLRYLGVTSTFTGEGRSTVASNLALSLAAAKMRVLLVDADVYAPTLSRAFTTDKRRGFVEYLRSDKQPLSKFVTIENRTNLHFLPKGGAGDSSVGNLWGIGLDRFMEETAAAYDYVIFDLPTLSTPADVRAAAQYMNGFLLVVGWHQVSAESIQVGMNAAAGLPERLVGTVLNNVNAKETRWALSPQVSFARRRRQWSPRWPDVPEIQWRWPLDWWRNRAAT